MSEVLNKQKVGRLRYVIDRDGISYNRLSDVITPGRITSIVGAGGKTSTMYTIGRELACEGEDVILTTSTRILPFENELEDNIEVIGVITPEGKLKGINNPDSLSDNCDRLLIEADGSRGFPVKMPAEHEPVITEGTDTVIALFGLSGIGQPIKDVCHRIEYVTRHLNKNEEDILTVEDAIKIITSECGLRKNVVDRTLVIILNQADSEKEIALGLKIASKLPEDIQCVITAYEDID